MSATPHDQRTAENLVSILIMLVALADQRGDYAPGIPTLQRARQVIGGVAQQEPANAEALRHLGDLSGLLSSRLMRFGRRQEAADMQRESIDVHRRLFDLDRDNLESLEALARSHRNLADTLLALGQPVAALSETQTELRLLQDWYRRRDAGAAARELLLRALLRQGGIQAALRQQADADKSFTEGMALARMAVLEAPEDMNAGRLLAQFHQERAQMLRRFGQTREATQQQVMALDVLEGLLPQLPDNFELLSSLALAAHQLRGMARQEQDQGTLHRARAASERYARQLYDLDPSGPRHGFPLALHLIENANDLIGVGSIEEAVELIEHARPLMVRLTASTGPFAQLNFALASIDVRLANAALERRESRLALRHANAGLELADAILAQDRDARHWHMVASQAALLRAVALVGVDRGVARDELDRTIERVEEWKRRFPADPEAESLLRRARDLRARV